MKLWQKGAAAHEKVDSFTVGKDREYDLVLAQYDCEASMAHAKMLGAIGLITIDEARQLCKVLEALKEDAEKGVFTIENEFEDFGYNVKNARRYQSKSKRTPKFKDYSDREDTF